MSLLTYEIGRHVYWYEAEHELFIAVKILHRAALRSRSYFKTLNATCQMQLQSADFFSDKT